MSLLPCPFCGGEADSNVSDYGGLGVECEGCGIRMEIGHHCRVTYEDAEKAWNTRAKPKLPLVKPEEMIDGMTYLCRGAPEYGGDDTVAVCEIEYEKWDIDERDMVDCDPFPVMWVPGGDYPLGVGHFEAIWGPLPQCDLEQPDSAG